MAHQMMKYKLNADGTIPSFLNTSNNGVGGQWPNPIAGQSGPQDMWLVGIANDGANLPSGQAEVIASKADLKTYLDSYTSSWIQPDPAQPGNIDATIPFDQQAAADWAWARLETLNS
jgi:hypothetical protein